MAIIHIEKVTLSQTSRSVCTRVRMPRYVWKDKRMINDHVCCWVLFFCICCEVKQKRYVIFRKLSVRVIDITFKGAEPPRRLNQVRVLQFSKCFLYHGLPLFFFEVASSLIVLHCTLRKIQPNIQGGGA